MSVDSAVYASALVSFMKGDIDMETSTVKIIAVTSTYSFDDTDEFLDDVAAGVRLGTAATLTSKTFGSVGKGKFNAAGLTYTGLDASDEVDGFIGYVVGGSEATSPLVWYANHSADAVEMSYTSDGSGLSIAWPLGFIFSI